MFCLDAMANVTLVNITSDVLLHADAREVCVSFLVGYPKWKVRCSAAASSLSKDTKVCLP